jgi:Abnormal spindle-like microcephaly-assoc'd, ASPM-SPD-2-Hydin
MQHPVAASEDKQWHAVDNFAGAGNGNVYLLSRNFGAGNGIYCYRSTDNGNTFGPNGGVLITPGFQGAFVAIGPDHAVYAFWYAGSSIQMRKSTDFGVSFGAVVTVASGLVGGTNGDLGLTGLRQGTATFASFRSSEFPHVAINPVSGNIYTVFANNPAGVDKADIFLVQSNNGGTTWSAPVRVNDDATTTDQWQPTIAVTPDGANVGVFYYSRQEDVANNNLYRFYGRTGVAGATITFLPSFAISDVPSLPEFGRDVVINTVYMGDYDYAVATPGKFHVVWSDCRLDLTGGAGRKDPNVFYKSIDAAALVGPNINVAPANVDFGNVAVSQTGNSTITITNTGDAPLTVSAISAPGGVFTLSGLPVLPAVIPSLGNVTFTASFTPTALGVQNANFTITSNAVNTPSVTVNLTGTGVTNISVSPLTVNFGDVPVGNTAGPVPVTIRNIGGLDLIVTGISTPAGNFSITHPAVPITISAGGSVIVNASFAPLSSGPHSSSFVITSDALGTPTVTVSLLGNGITPPPNDLCDNAILIGCGASVNGTTVLATFDNVGTCGTSNTAPGVWYKTIGTGSPITVSTCTAASYDTKLSVFSGTCAAKVCVGGNDDFCSLRSQVTFNSVAGTTYYILVHGFGTAVGTFTLTTSQCPALISVTPSPLIINVPFNGTGSGTLNVANTAGTGGTDLNWVITNTGPTSISGSPNSYSLAATPTVLFQVTDATITALRAVHVPAAIWRSVETLIVQTASNKEDFVTMLVNILGADNTNSFYQLIMDNTIQFYDEIKGQSLVDQTAAGGPDVFGYKFKDSDEPGGPTFSWTDITGTGTPVVLGDD